MYEEYVIAEGWFALYGVLEYPCCDDCAILCSFRHGTFCALSLLKAPPAECVNDKRSLCRGMCVSVFFRNRHREKTQVRLGAFGKVIIICSFH